MTTVRIVPVPFAPKYHVTDDGRVFREVTCSDDGKGYLRVDLPHAGKAHYPVRVNRLVAGAFLPDPEPEQDQVRHLNGAPQDNRAENLAWGTPQQNIDDRERHGNTVRGERHGCAKLDDSKATAIRRLSAQGWSQRALALRFDVDRRTVGRVLSGTSWTEALEIDRLLAEQARTATPPPTGDAR